MGAIPREIRLTEVRQKALRSLGRLKVRRAVPIMVIGLSEEMAGLRKEAAAALGEIAHPAARLGLEGLVNDPDPNVRKTARWALVKLAVYRIILDIGSRMMRSPLVSASTFSRKPGATSRDAGLVLRRLTPPSERSPAAERAASGGYAPGRWRRYHRVGSA